MSNLVELMACPFCGGMDFQNYTTFGSHQPIIDDCGTSWCVMCNGCSATIGESCDYTQEQSIEYWNRRIARKDSHE